MNKSRTLILKTGLCGLVLSSLFLLNNKAVVHADAVTDGSQSNAISWNSDSDAAQNVQNTQKADDNQQNAQSVQPSRVEMSTVSSVSAAPRTTNQNTAVQSPKISNINDAQAAVPVVINNPANNKVHVHYIDSNGNAVDNSSHDYDIDATKTGHASYTVPNGYSLNVPNGNYNVSGGKFGADTLKGNVEHHAAVTHKVTQWAEYDDNGQYKVIYGMSDYAKKHAEQEYEDNVLAETGDGAPKWQKQIKTITDKPAYDEQQLPVAFVDSNNNIVGMIQNYTGKVGTTQNVNLTVPTGYKLADGQTMPTSVTFQNSTNPLLVKVGPSGKKTTVTPSEHTLHIKFVDQATGKEVAGGYDLDINTLTGNTGTYNVPAGYSANNNSYQINKAITLGTESFDNNNRDAPSVPLTSIMTKSQANKMYTDFKKIKNIVNSKGFDVENNELEVSFNNSYESPSSPLFCHSKWDSSFDHVARIPGVPGNDFVYGVFAHRKGTDWVYAVNFSLPTFTISSLTQSELKQIHQKYLETFKNNVQSPLDMFMSERNYPVSITDTGNMVSGDTITVPVHQTKSFSFADNSGNVKSVSGNTVDVTLTKPQSVNPAMDTRCQSQATRTIQINFPDGQIPEAYDGIVDKSGKLVQTVHFTRTATEDALTGNILQYGNWTSDNQDHNFIGFEARTLPRIPGYTLKISPVQA